MKKKYVITIVIVLFIVLAFVVSMFFIPQGPDLSAYAFLKEPRIAKLPDQRMLEVRVTGDPTTAGKDAFGQLFKVFYALKRKTGGLEMAAPRARWPKSFDTPRNEWVGIYGLPISQTITALPDQDAAIKAVIATWEYGEVAEILHVGSYATETTTIRKLHAFIEQQGYEISGPHEEEYLKGPGMFLKGDPDTYRTIIRYTIKKKV